MNRTAHKLFSIIFCAAILLDSSTQAAVTNIVWYRLGENDLGATVGGVATGTRDLVGSIDLPLNAGPLYSADVAPSAAAHTGSSLSMQFSGSQWGTNALIPSILNNFGLEAWVKSSGPTSVGVIAYNGNTAFSGWGLIQVGTNYQALFGGSIIFGAGAAASNVWTHLALVRDGGLSTFYVNGVASGTSAFGPFTPSGGFGLGAPPQNPGSQFLSGSLDEVRVFTFAPGQFSTNDLLLNRKQVVTTRADGGPGSLRTIIANAFDGDTITFNLGSELTNTITLTNGVLQPTSGLRIIGPGPDVLSISGGGSNRVFSISAGLTTVISGLTIRDGFTTNNPSGGAIYNAGTLSLSNCVVSFNHADKGANGVPASFPNSPTSGGAGKMGGAIANVGTVNLVACTFHDNMGGTGGDGVGATLLPLAFSGTSGGNGGDVGALFNSGNAVLSACTFYTNSGGVGGSGGAAFGSLINPGPGGTGGSGGAIYNVGTMTLTVCTVDGNAGGVGGRADGGTGDLGPSGNNGCIYTSGTITFIGSTVTRNAGVGVNNVMFATARNSLFALNTGAGATDYVGSFSSQGHNLIGNNAGSFGFFPGNNNDIVGTSTNQIDPLIGPLTNNGGPTLTVKLLAGSPALEAGDDLLPFLNVPADQRGQPRKTGAHVDIGAYEVVLGAPPTLTGTSMGLNRVFHFGFTNVPQAEFTVLTATNLSLPVSAWTALGAPTESSPGQFQFLSLPQTNDNQRFYQVRSP